MLYVKKITIIEEFYELERMCWQGALDTLKDIEEHDKEDELMQHLNDMLEALADDSAEIEDTKLNDYLWFERDYIYECLGIDEEEDDE